MAEPSNYNRTGRVEALGGGGKGGEEIFDFFDEDDGNGNSSINNNRDNAIVVDLTQESKSENAAAVSEVGEEAAQDEDDKNSFSWVLLCARTPEDQPPRIVLEWYSPRPPTKVSQEEAVLENKLLRWHNKERGLSRNAPEWRKRELLRLSERYQIPIYQLLSLRRHHIKQLNPRRSMTALGLGKEEDIRISAMLFEQSVSDFLTLQNIGFYSEDNLKEHIRKHRGDRPFPPTPDFVLHNEILIEQYYYQQQRVFDQRQLKRHRSGNDQHPQQQKQQQQKRRIVRYRQRVCWVDAKMFYGASTIDHDNASAVGCLLNTARKYTEVYGPGAFVFMLGCGDQLAHDLQQEGAMALDCSGDMFSLSRVHEHQRTWCGDENGEIWP